MTTVVTYANDRLRCFCQIRFDSGERVLISIATLPKPTVKISRLALGGLLPTRSVWECNLTEAERIFSSSVPGPSGVLDAIRDVLLSCASLDEARRRLAQRESRTVPRPPASLSPFDEAMLQMANELCMQSGISCCQTLADAASTVLVHITLSMLDEDGVVPLSPATPSSVDDLWACFMAVCLFGIWSRSKALQEEGVPYKEVYWRAGLAVFQMRSLEDQARTMQSGGKCYSVLVQDNRENVQKWLKNVWTLIAGFVMTGDIR